MYRGTRQGHSCAYAYLLSCQHIKGECMNMMSFNDLNISRSPMSVKGYMLETPKVDALLGKRTDPIMPYMST